MTLSRPAECTTTNEQDVGGVHLQEFLLRMLSPALRRHRGNVPFDQLQKRLLHALTGDVAGDGRVVDLREILSISSM